jgi:aspartyl-tRNA(Asn)/glutamyl-tRNA(Gln) amidotransferase subunit B
MLTYAHLSELNDLVGSSKLSSSAAKEVLLEIALSGKSAQDTAIEKNLLQVSDESQLESFVLQVLKENPQAVTDIKNGEQKAVGFLVGQVMKISKGQANPGMVNKIIHEKLKDEPAP